MTEAEHEAALADHEIAEQAALILSACRLALSLLQEPTNAGLQAILSRCIERCDLSIAALGKPPKA